MKRLPAPAKNLEKTDPDERQSRLTTPEQEQARLREQLAVVQGERDRYRELIEKANDIVCFIDTEGYFTYVNAAAEQITGYPKKELLGRHYLTLIRPDYRDEAARTYAKQLVYQKADTYFEFPITTREGREVWIGQYVQLVLSGETVQEFRAMARDITKQKQIEEGWKKYQEQLETIGEAQTFELKKKNKILEQELAERRQVESALLESQEKYQSILKTIEEGYYEVDLKGNMAFFNDAISEIHGYSKNELMGMNSRDYTDARNAKIIYQHFNKVYRTGAPCKSCEYEIIPRSGQRKMLESSVSLIRDSTGVPVGFRGITRDITERKQAEEDLRLSEKKFSKVFQTIPDAVSINRLDDGVYLDINEGFTKILGYSREEVLGRSFLTNDPVVWVNPADQDRLLHLLKTAGEVIGFEAPIRGKDERTVFGRLLARFLEVAGETCIFRIFSDITEQKKNEEKIRLAKEEWEQTFDSVPDLMAIVGDDFRISRVNRAMAERLNLTLPEINGKHCYELFHGLQEPVSYCPYHEIVSRGEEISAEIEEPQLRGCFHLTATPLAGTKSVIHVFRDITERKRTEEALKKTHGRIALLLNSISSILVAVSEDNRIVFWNTMAEKEFNIPGKAVEGKPLRDAEIRWDWGQIEEAISRCRKEDAPVGLDNLKFLQGNEQEGLLGLRITPIHGEESLGMVTLIQGANITERKILESQLTQAQKMESIGQLAAGIAHEINTPTQYVGDNVRFLQTAFEDVIKVLRQYERARESFKKEAVREDLFEKVEEAVEEADLEYLTEEIPKAFQQTLDGVDRVSRIVQSIKAFAHPGKEEKVLIDLNKAVENTVVVTKNEWKYVADVVTELDPSLPLVPCIPGDINQVLLNILVNAAQAVAEIAGNGSGKKGTITMATRQEDGWAEIRISDTGKGIPEGIRSKIFDPFFTTKEVGKGTGQGLAISHAAIVERHQGSIGVKTEIDRGTTFIVRLPLG